MKVNHQGYLKNYGWVWYDRRAVSNILCLHNMKKKYKVTYDSGSGDTFVVHKKTHLLQFVSNSNGLYYHDTDNRQITLLDENKVTQQE